MSAFTVKHELITKNGKIRFRKFSEKGYEHFHIKLFIDGPLEKVKLVEYELHPTFKQTNRVSHQSENHFAVKIWTWGEFDVLVTIHPLHGERIQIVYPLKFSQQLPADPQAYIDETKLSKGVLS